MIPRAWMCFVVVAVGAFAHGQNLVYFEENGGGGNPRGLYNLNAATGAATLRTAVGGSERFFSLAVHPRTGTVFAVSVPGNTGLWTINIDTGVATLVGFTGVDTMADITFHPMTEALYGVQRNTPYNFYQINPATGAATLLGALNDAVRCGLTFAPDGTLYGFTTTGVLSRVTLSPLGTTLVGGTPGSFLVEDATVTASGQMFFTTFTGEVYRVDRFTGARVLVHSTGMGSGLLGIIESPAPCYPDCNADGALSLADFGCFQTRFALGEPWADCNADGALSLADFGCFQTRFALGCP